MASGSLERVVRLWETTPQSDRLHARFARRNLLAQAQPIVNDLLEEFTDAERVRAALRDDPNLDEPLRHAALDLLMGR
jgi:hypothetical protein